MSIMFNLNLLLSKEELNSKGKSMDQCLEGLFHKRGSTREMALAMLVDKFCKKLQNEFLVNKCSTLLYQCFNSLKRGSSKEIYLASRLIGFVSVTIGCKEDLAHKVLEDAFPLLSEALQSKFDPIEISSLLDCLAIITFVGGDDLSETERSMQLIWQFCHPKLGNNMVAPTPSAMVLTTALSAWSFLLSTMDVLKVNKTCWKEVVSYFSDLLDHDDLSVRITAAEAIALIFEMGSLEKFCSEAKSSNEQLVHEGSKCQESQSDIEGLKEKILNQMTNLSMEADDEVVPKNDSQKKLIDDVLRFLEDNVCLKTSIKVGRSGLNISKWSRLLQVNFMMRFLGPGFVKHMQENEFLHDVFDFKPKEKQHISSENQLLSEMFTCDHEEVVLKNFYQAKQWELEEEEEIEGRQPYQKKKTSACPDPALKKAKNQVRRQNRLISQARNAGHMAVGLEGEDLKEQLVESF
ncbi:interferon-related developmental regulator 1-like isoform X1 [Papaver somniferum]|uniref:interferon-related developmental regulator 1-like isoform X1 n=1 Tax=Papaver somniferum TaxID=3469 RepID=UPI000E702B40|nr:interferon-related developmental regulator 1-like isoform X1 [Papaver somniferum]